MNTDQNSKKVIHTSLMLKLHNDNMTGVVTVKDSQKAIRIYLQGGHVVYAEGIDKDSRIRCQNIVKMAAGCSRRLRQKRNWIRLY